MIDPAHEETERLIKRLEKQINAEYNKAYTDMVDKYNDYMRRFRIKDDIKRKAVKDGLISKSDYLKWRKDQVYNAQRMNDMCEALAHDLTQASVNARSLALNGRLEAYALNHNFAGYVIEQTAGVDLSFTLYSRETVARLLRDQPKLIPSMNPFGKTAMRIAEGKELAWDMQKINSVIVQGVLQGESIPNIATRLQGVADMSLNAAIRNARTMMTSAQNAGRIDAELYAQSKGVEMTNVWAAALDNRTRHEHRELDGQRRPIDKPFKVDGYEIRYPGDPEAEAFLVYNCRCTLIPQVKGFEYDIHKSKNLDLSQIGGKTYSQWKAEKKSVSNPITLPVQKAEAMKRYYANLYKKLKKGN